MTSKEIVTGGIRSFFIESKLIQLVLEGGSFFFFSNMANIFMRSVFMGKKASQWLMSKIEIIVVEDNAKQFFMFWDGDT